MSDNSKIFISYSSVTSFLLALKCSMFDVAKIILICKLYDAVESRMMDGLGA